MKTSHPLRSFHTLLLAASVACAPVCAGAATASELFEKGLYAEETKGDPDAAIRIYEQIIAEGKAAHSLAARAQYRLGLCLLKKNRQQEARAAFEKLIREYPSQKELVAQARKELPADPVLAPAPWVDGERMQLVLTLQGGEDIGVMEYRVFSSGEAGRKVWKAGLRSFAGQANSLSSVTADAETFRPLNSTWKHTQLGEASAEFREGEVIIHRPGKEAVTVPVNPLVYDNEQTLHLIRRFPLAEGFKTNLAVFSSLGGGQPIPIGLEVTGKETVQAPAGTFECFKLRLSVGQTFWFSTDARRLLVKMDTGAATALLTSIAQRSASDPVPFRDESLGVSFTAPANWVLHRRQGDAKPDVVFMLDPAADCEGISLRLIASKTLTEEARQSSRAWAEAEVNGRITKQIKDLTMRADGWREQSVAGRPGAGFTADYTEKEQAMVLYTLYVKGPEVSEQFLMRCPADKFPALKEAFDSITASYKTR